MFLTIDNIEALLHEDFTQQIYSEKITSKKYQLLCHLKGYYEAFFIRSFV